MGKWTADTLRQDQRYWLYEEPVKYATGKNAIRYYPEAGKVQFALPDYTAASLDRSGNMREETRPGRLAALDLNALREDPETLQWLIGILQGLAS